MSEEHKQRIDRELRQFGGTKNIIPIQAYRLAELLYQHSIGEVDFMSLDVEGAEIEVLQGVEWSEVTIRFLLIEEDSAQKIEQLTAFLEPLGYERRAFGRFNGLYSLL